MRGPTHHAVYLFDGTTKIGGLKARTKKRLEQGVMINARVKLISYREAVSVVEEDGMQGELPHP